MAAQNIIEVMQNAKTDLCATLDGQFSPEDWSRIVARAEARLEALLTENPAWNALEAWRQVMREFNQSHQWGFVANYKPPKVKKPVNLGLKFIWMTFSAMVFSKVLILWYGQIYSRSDDPGDKWIFFSILAFSFGSFAYFLWKHQSHPD